MQLPSYRAPGVISRPSYILRSPPGELELEKAIAADEVAHLLLHRIEANETARLALKMVNDGRQGLEILATVTVRAVVQSLLVWSEPLAAVAH